MASSAALSDQYEVLGNFSFDQNGKYHNDLSQRRFLVEPDDDNPNFDVQGFDENTVRHSRNIKPISLRHVLGWIRDHRDELVEKKIILKSGGSSRKLAVNFVGRSGFFSQLLRASNSLDQLEILVTLCNGTYYIENIGDFREATTGRKEMTYSWSKFVHNVTSPDGNAPDTDKPVSPIGRYHAVMKTQHGNHKIILSTDVQAERKDSNHGQSPPGNYVCIKTRKEHFEGKPLRNFDKYTTLKWWSLANIAGIPAVMCGMRDDDRHLITSLETIKTDQLHLRSEGFWDPILCQEKFESYLSEIKALVQDDDPRAVYRLQMPVIEQDRPYLKARLQAKEFNLVGRREDDYVILPDAYLRDVLNMKEY